MYDGRVPGTTSGRLPMQVGLRPMSCFEVEDDDVRKVGSVLVLAPVDEELITLP